MIAHNSSLAYGGRAADASAASRDLGVRYVLHGSVRKAATGLELPRSLWKLTPDATSGESGTIGASRMFSRSRTKLLLHCCGGSAGGRSLGL